VPDPAPRRIYRPIAALALEPPASVDDGWGMRWILACGHSVDVQVKDGLTVIEIAAPQWCPTCTTSEAETVRRMGAKFDR